MTSKRVTIEALSPDMVVAESVSDRSGRLLVGAGDVVSIDHIQNLRAWGVSDVLVESAEGEKGDSHEAPADDLLSRFALNDTSVSPFPTLLDVCEAQITMGFTR